MVVGHQNSRCKTVTEFMPTGPPRTVRAEQSVPCKSPGHEQLKLFEWHTLKKKCVEVLRVPGKTILNPKAVK